MLGIPVLLLALLLSGPALWAGFVTGTLDQTDALIRFLIAVPFAAAGVALLRSLTTSYHQAARKAAKAKLAAGEAPPVKDTKQR